MSYLIIILYYIIFILSYNRRYIVSVIGELKNDINIFLLFLEAVKSNSVSNLVYSAPSPILCTSVNVMKRSLVDSRAISKRRINKVD